MFKCHACILKWVALKRRRKCALISREMQIEVGVLLEGDTCTTLVTIEVPKDFRKRRTGTELLCCMNKIIIQYEPRVNLAHSRVTTMVSASRADRTTKLMVIAPSSLYPGRRRVARFASTFDHTFFTLSFCCAISILEWTLSGRSLP
jgi:hypothetical protein